MVTTSPRIRLEVTVSDGESLMRGLRQRDLDVVILRQVASAVDADIIVKVLHKAPLVALASKTHPLASKRKLKLESLANERWTLSPSTSPLGLIVARTFAAERMEVPAAAVIALSIYLRLALVSDGRFLTMVPQATAQHSLVRDWAKVLPLQLAPAPGAVCLVRVARRNPIGAVLTFCRQVEEVLDDYRAAV